MKRLAVPHLCARLSRTLAIGTLDSRSAAGVLSAQRTGDEPRRVPVTPRAVGSIALILIQPSPCTYQLGRLGAGTCAYPRRRRAERDSTTDSIGTMAESIST